MGFRYGQAMLILVTTLDPFLLSLSAVGTAGNMAVNADIAA